MLQLESTAAVPAGSWGEAWAGGMGVSGCGIPSWGCAGWARSQYQGGSGTTSFKERSCPARSGPHRTFLLSSLAGWWLKKGAEIFGFLV